MPYETLGFFASDGSELYKANAYRALALPGGYVLHLRYRKKHIHPDVIQHLHELVNRPATVFYVSGNDISVPEAQRKVTTYSLREAVVEDCEDNVLTGTVHFYLRLGAFVDTAPLNQADPKTLPPYLFVTSLTVEKGANPGWTQRIDAIKADFPLPFFAIESVSKKGHALAPSYSEYTKSSSYALDEETGYVLHVTMYDPHGAQSGLAAENTSTDVTLSIPPNYRIGAGRETRRFDLDTHSLSRQSASAVTRLVPVTDLAKPPDASSPDYRVQLDWKLSRGRWKALAFAALSIVAALGVAATKLATDDLSKATISRWSIPLGIGGLLAIGVSTGWFYHAFNKK